MFKRLLAAFIAVCLLAPSAASAAYQFANRAWMSSATTGTGTITLGSAQPGYLTFAQAGVTNGNTVTYVIVDGNNFEVGRGVYTSSGTTLSRSVLISLISGVSGTTALTLSGTETVYVTPAAEDMLSTNTPITVGQGGTGITSGTSGGVPYFSSGSAISSSGALSANQLVLGGGAGASPTSLAAGTTTTLLHGNAGGAPSFGSVVSGDLNITTTTCTNQFVTALSAAAAGTCTTDTLAGAQHANQGTTTTVLHGNAAGNPSWAGVSLTADAAANQGTTTTLLHGNAAGQPSFGSVVSGDLNITTTTCTNQFVTALSAAAAGTCSTATLAGAQFANQGTTTTLLHGNGAGNPSWAGVSLTSDAAANQGTTATVLHGNAAGQPSFGSVALGTDISGTLGIGNGGTSQTTALAARGSSGLNVESGTGHGDSIYTILATDRYVFTNAAFTASRTWTLPAANAVNAGGVICVADQQGTVTATNTLVISRAGTDTINGGTTYTLNGAFEGMCLVSDGAAKWTLTGRDDIGTANQIMLGGGASATPSPLGSLGTTTTVLHGNASGAPTFGSIASGDLNITTTTCTNQFVTAISASASGTCTSDVLASAQHANEGTTTTVLHGNGAGNPSWAGVSLVNDAAANQGTTTTVLHGNAAGQPSFGSVASGDLNITTTACTNQYVSAISAGGVGTCATVLSSQVSGLGTAATQNTGTSGANLPFLNGANTWSGAQSVNSGDLKLNGATSGAITLNAAATAGANTITLPAGTTDFSATGGASQFVKQASVGGALTVARPACADLSDSSTGCSGNADPWTTVTLAADSTFTSNTTFATIVSWAVSGTTEYQWKCEISLGGTVTGGGFKAQFTGPTNSFLQIMGDKVQGAGASAHTPTMVTAFSSSIASDSGVPIDFTLTVQGNVVTTGSGTIALQMAQNASSANSLIVKKGSYCEWKSP